VSTINKATEINERIRDAQVRLLDSDGAQLGIMSARDAYLVAVQKNLDLVKISPTAVPPVCKIMDYGKFKFDSSKREKEMRKNQKTVELKEIRLSMTIDEGDVNTKIKHATKFLEGGDRVKVSLRMRGRQQAHANIGMRKMEDFCAQLAEVCVVEVKPSRESNYLTMILAPKKDAKKN